MLLSTNARLRSLVNARVASAHAVQYTHLHTIVQLYAAQVECPDIACMHVCAPPVLCEPCLVSRRVRPLRVPCATSRRPVASPWALLAGARCRRRGSQMRVCAAPSSAGGRRRPRWIGPRTQWRPILIRPHHAPINRAFRPINRAFRPNGSLPFGNSPQYRPKRLDCPHPISVSECESFNGRVV